MLKSRIRKHFLSFVYKNRDLFDINNSPWYLFVRPNLDKSMNLNITLVDILHDEKTNCLVSADLEDALLEKVLSKVNLDTKICVEGINMGVHGLPPDNQHYSHTVKKLWPGCVNRIAPITLYGTDPRCRVGFFENARRSAELDAMLVFLDKNLIIPKAPSSIEEALQWIRNGDGNLQRIGKPDLRTKKLADSMYRLEKTWIKNYANLAVSYAQNGKFVYVIAGLSHILQLHVQCGWPMMWLSKNHPWITPENVYRSGMNLTHFLDAIRRL